MRPWEGASLLGHLLLLIWPTSFNFLLNNLIRDMAYHVRANFGFNTNDQGNAQIYIVVYDNGPIFDRWLLLGMASNVWSGCLKLC